MGIKNPILDLEPTISVRDPALIYHDGQLDCYYSAVEYRAHKYTLYLDRISTSDFVHWSKPERIFQSNNGFSSPGNIIQFNNQWVICFQTYPIPRFQSYASQSARLWISFSNDLISWSNPQLIARKGAEVKWSVSHRQIDPYLVIHNEEVYCFYKVGGALGLLKSADLKHWQEVAVDRPILSKKDVQDHATMENPCIIPTRHGFRLFFSPSRKGRGIGVADSVDLIHWSNIHYLAFPSLDWAFGGPTAPMVIDLRDFAGYYVMAFHGDRKRPHGGALGLAWSKDLENWEVPN